MWPFKLTRKQRVAKEMKIILDIDKLEKQRSRLLMGDEPIQQNCCVPAYQNRLNKLNAKISKLDEKRSVLISSNRKNLQP